jgi:two-component system sensor histidine kinase YesM
MSRGTLSMTSGVYWVKRRWQSRSLSSKLILFYLPLFVLPSVFGLLLLSKNYNDTIKENAAEYSESVINLTANKLDDVIEVYNRLSLQILTSSDIGSLVAAPVSNEFEWLENQKSLERVVNPILGAMNSPQIIGSVFISESRHYMVGSDVAPKPGPEFLNAVAAKNGAPVWVPVESNWQEGGVQAFRVGRILKDDHFRPIGTFYLVINTSVFQDILQSAIAGPSISFQMKQGQSILLEESFQQNGVVTQILKKEVPVGQNGWTLSVSFSLKTLYSTVYSMSLYTAWLVLICIIAGVIASQTIRSDVAVPIVRLMKNMKQGLSGGTPQSLRKFPGAREITELNDTFIAVMYEIYNLIDEVKKNESQKHKAQLKVLQNQLSPHFLYNTLNSIRWMAMIRKQDHIRDMVDALSNVLRYSIRETDKLVTLDEEIRIMGDFVKIQQVRYQNFSFVVEIDESVRPYRVLKFLLQPLLENAIIHGLSSIGHAGEIRLKVTCDQMLHIWICDNGSGITAQRLAEVREELMNSPDDGHIGLTNVRERIELHYGAPFGMDIYSESGRGTTVELRLPVIKEESNHADD